MASADTIKVANLRFSDLVVTNITGLDELQSIQGPPGEPGADGYTPEVELNTDIDGYTFRIKPKDSGWLTARLTNGKDGEDGKDGGAGLDINELLQYFGTVTVVKPPQAENQRLNLSAVFYMNAECSGTYAFAFDTAESLYKQNTYAFAGGIGNADSFTTNGSWLKMTEAGLSAGLGPEFDNYPVLLDLKNVITNNQTVLAFFTNSKRFYAKYAWYWKDSQNSLHYSDNYSLVFPSIPEAASLLQAINSNGNNRQLNLQSSPLRSQQTTLMAASPLAYTSQPDEDDYFVMKPDMLNIITTSLNDDNARLLLSDYSTSKSYKMQFQIGDQPLSMDSVEIWCRLQSGADLRAEAIERNLNCALKKYNRSKAASASFNKNTKYLVQFELEMVTLLTSAEIIEDQD